MTDKRDISNNISEDSKDLPDFIFTESALLLQSSMEDILADLVNRVDLGPSDEEFYLLFHKFFNLYDRFQQEVITASGIKVVCGAGCSKCCSHWVEDVSSSEGAVIGRYLTENHPEMLEFVVSSFRKDFEEMESLCDRVDAKIAEYCSDSEEISDSYELLLSCFYQLERPCALLDVNGCCTVYPVRPLTCRDYLNLRDSSVCLPERINEGENATLILHLSDSVSQMMEILHQRFDDGSDDMSLRTLLVKFLEPVVEDGRGSDS